MVRAKFKVTQITRQMGSKSAVDVDGKTKYVPYEMQSIKLAPVYANGDPNHENSKFWAATPGGEINLFCANAETVKQFELDREYYVDFTLAE